MSGASSSSRPAFEPMSYESIDDIGIDPEDDMLEAQVRLADLLINMKMSGKLSAQDVCLLMHWAVKAGLPSGPAAELGYLASEGQTGHYNKHINKVIGLGRQLEGAIPWLSLALTL